MELRLPDELRKRLVSTSGQYLPLAYLARQALRRALDGEAGWEVDVTPGNCRPILLQLSTEEQARLDIWMTARGVNAEVAVLSLISAVV